ncbi:MAG: protein BatD [Deltaproteobacteria bacterium]|nr:protein BatD [Deltaproteobacteria bacterium]
MTAEIDAPAVTIDEEASITVSVSGNLNASDPVIPQVQGLEIIQVGRTSQIQIVNGNMSITAQFLYTLVPSEEGDFVIPPFKMVSGGKQYASNPLKLKVTRNSYSGQVRTAPYNMPVQQQQQPQQQPQQTMPQAPTDADPKFWIATSVSNPNPYVSEQILYRFKLYTRENITQAAPELPQFTDFWSETVVGDQRGTEEINGVNYATWEKVIALMPLKEGKIQIEAALLDIVYEVYDQPTRSLNRWDPFFNSSFFNRALAQQKKASLKSRALEINVKPLPKPYPANFTGLVGEFGVQANLSGKKITTDDSITMTLGISGSGNIKDAALPDLKFKDFKVYFDKPSTEQHKSEDGISGRKIFKIVFVPQREGTLKIPEFTLGYFNPKKDNYIQVRVPEQVFEVSPGKQQKTNTVLTNPVPLNDDQGVQYQDIAPIFNTAADVMGLSPLIVGDTLFGVVVLGLPALFVLFFTVTKISKRPRESKKKKTRMAYQKLLKQLEVAKGGDVHCLECVRDYISAAFDVQGQALTAMEIQELCIKNKIAPKLAEGLGTAIQNIEMAQYGFDKEQVMDKVSKVLKKVVSEIHNEVKAKL